MTIEELRDRCKVWQERLRLQDWIVELTMVRQWEIPNSFGTCDPMLQKRRAKIKILDPVDDGDPGDFEKYDPEVTLVHELLHLHFDSYTAKDWDSLEGQAQHFTIHALSGALVALDRK